MPRREVVAMKRFVAASVQFSVKPMDTEENMKIAKDWVYRCHESSLADLIVLPESVTTGFSPAGDVGALWDVIDAIPGKFTDEVTRWAQELGTYIVFPTYERGDKEGVIYNSAALIGPGGVMGVYRKTHPFPSERLEGGGWTTPGKEPCCVETPLGKIGIIICYDGDFPELSRVTALMGAEVICRPSAFLRTFDQWELTNKARAYDNHVYVIATNSVGFDASGAQYFGGSMIVHPSGMKLAQARCSDEFIWVTLDPNPISTITPNSSSPQYFDHIEDRNLEAYRGILQKGKCAFEPAKRIPYSYK